MSGPRGAEALLETLLVEKGTPRNLGRHRDRMERSARALGWPFDGEAFGTAVEEALAEASYPRARLRLLLAPTGSCIAALYALAPAPDGVVLALSPRRVLSQDPLRRHKILPRELYEAVRAEAGAAGAWDGILLNERGEVAETGRASVVALLEGELLTPPLEAGVLEGVTRGLLLEGGVLREERLTAADLGRTRALFVLNALVGALPVVRIEGVEAFQPEPGAMIEGLERLRRVLADSESD